MSRARRFRHYGRVMLRICRAFRVAPEPLLTTRELLERTHPRLRKRNRKIRLGRDRDNAARSVRRAAARLCIRVGRSWPGGVVWRLRTEKPSEKLLPKSQQNGVF
jgi:hypothetical protein